LVTTHKQIELSEDDLIDIFLVLVDTDDEILDDMLNAKDVEKKKEYLRNSLKIHEKIEFIAQKLGIET
jgi:hypothetical protein